MSPVSVPVKSVLDRARELTHSKFAIIDPQTRKTYWFSYNATQPNQEVPLLKKLRPQAYQGRDIEDMRSNARASLGGLIYVNSFTNTDLINYYL